MKCLKCNQEKTRAEMHTMQTGKPQVCHECHAELTKQLKRKRKSIQRSTMREREYMTKSERDAKIAYKLEQWSGRTRPAKLSQNTPMIKVDAVLFDRALQKELDKYEL